MPSIQEIYPSSLLKAEDIKKLPSGKATLEISAARVEPVGQENKLVVNFVGLSKGLALNKTNAHKIAEFLGDDYTVWAGKKIEIYTIVTNFKHEEVDAIRVRRPGE